MRDISRSWSGVPLLLFGLMAHVVCVPAAAIADEAQDAAQIAKALANPNATLGFMGFPIDWILYDGDLPDASNQTAFKINFQPSVPYPVGEGTNFFVRPLFPLVVQQPVPTATGFENKGVALGDIGMDAAIGRTFENGTVLIGGVVASFPTATDAALGLDQYLLGPEALIGQATSWGFVGVLVTHQWDVAGKNKRPTSITGGQYFYTVNLENAWQIQATPTWAYDHNGPSGSQWTFPLGIGASKTIVRGATPWKFSLQYWYYIAAPEAFGPSSTFRFVITPVIPLPW